MAFQNNFMNNGNFRSTPHRKCRTLSVQQRQMTSKRAPKRMSSDDSKLKGFRQRPVGVATGNWGCGAYGGDVQLKALIQLMACAQAGRDMAYFSFGNWRICYLLGTLMAFAREQEVTVGQCFHMIQSFRNLSYHSCGLLEWIIDWLSNCNNTKARRARSNFNYGRATLV